MIGSMLRVTAMVAFAATSFAGAAHAVVVSQGVSLTGLSVSVPQTVSPTPAASAAVTAGPPWTDSFNGGVTNFTNVQSNNGPNTASAPVALTNGLNAIALNAYGADTVDNRYEFVFSFSDGKTIDAFLQVPASAGLSAATNPTQFVAAPSSSLSFTDSNGVGVTLGASGNWFPDPNDANNQQVGSARLIVSGIPSAVAEPASFALLAAGLVGVAFVRRRSTGAASA